MNIAGLCQRVIVTVSAGDTLRDAAALMRDEHVGALVVTGAEDAGQVVGVLTDRDLAVAFLAQGFDASEVLVGELVRREVITVPDTAGILEAVGAMEAGGVRRLLVSGDEGRIIGIVSADDLLDVIAAQLDGLARALRSGIRREIASSADSLHDEEQSFLPDGIMPGVH